jgi:hypothetical protein
VTSLDMGWTANVPTLVTTVPRSDWQRLLLVALAVLGWLCLLNLAFLGGVVGTLGVLGYAIDHGREMTAVIALLAVAFVCFEIRRALRRRWPVVRLVESSPAGRHAKEATL